VLGYAVRSGRSGGFCIAEDELQECGGTLDRMGALAAIQPDLDLRDTSRQLCTHSVGTEDVRAHSTDRILLEGNVALAGKQAVKYESELLPSGPGRLSRYDSRHPGCLRSLWSSPDLSFHQARLGQQLVHGFRRTCCNMIALQSESECAVSEAKSSGPSSDSFFRSASRRWTTPPPARSPFPLSLHSPYTRCTPCQSPDYFLLSPLSINNSMSYGGYGEPLRFHPTSSSLPADPHLFSPTGGGGGGYGGGGGGGYGAS
jgi:hypothetical protein